VTKNSASVAAAGTSPAGGRDRRFADTGLALALLSVVLLTGPVLAVAAEPLLVSADWLAEHVKDPNIVVLHVGERREFEAAHVPGANVISEEDVARPHDMSKGELMLEMPAPEQLRAQFQSRGVSDDSHIVVYAGRGTAAQSATRIVLTLDYLGLGERTSLLNGGLAAWQRSGKPVAKGLADAKQGRLSPGPTKPVIVDAEFVKSLAQRPHYKLVDARAPVYYKGIDATFGKSGHIPGAINIPYSSITDDRQLIDRTHVGAVFHEARIDDDDTIVVYCHVGQQATLVALGARLLGHPVMLYDGAFQDWATANRGPVEK
jgi:thiosulfate/3-mercaptopyruvate sulfurtransferase